MYVVLPAIIAVAFLILIAGCIPQKIKVPMQKPAEIDLKGSKKLQLVILAGLWGENLQMN